MIQRNIDLQLQALEILAQRYGLVPESFLPDGTTREQYLRGDNKLLEAVLKRSLDESEAEKALDEATKLIEKELVLHENPEPSTARSPSALLDVRRDEQPSRALSALRLNSAASGISPEEIKKRQEYLRKQRDKLIESKNKERRKHMEKLEESELLSQRPKSAKALKSFVEDEDVTPDDDDDKTHAFRLSLAKRLKAEVIGKETSAECEVIVCNCDCR